MPTFEFNCPRHGAFDKYLSFSDGVPPSEVCWCGMRSLRVFTAPAAALVRGGTGAGRGHLPARKESAWNEKASDLQRDPYTQAKAQLESMSRRASDFGDRPTRVTEESIQATAAAIQAGKDQPQRGVVQKQVSVANKMRADRRRNENHQESR